MEITTAEPEQQVNEKSPHVCGQMRRFVSSGVAGIFAFSLLEPNNAVSPHFHQQLTV